MSISRKLAGNFKRFLGCQSGTMSIIFSLSVIPLLAAVGAAVDYGRSADAQAEIQSALDAGALAGAAAKNMTPSERQKLVTAAVKSNLPATMAADVTLKVNVTKDNLSAVANYDMPTSFMSLVGINSTSITASNEVNINGSRKAEIVLVLDYSGSMSDSVADGPKYVSMRKAAIKLIDDLSATEKGKVKLGLAPFSHHVYGTLPSQFVAGQPKTGYWTGCTVDRLSPYNTTNQSPDWTKEDTKWGQKQAPLKDHLASGCDGYAKHNLKLLPLTTDLSAPKNQLNAMSPYAWTHIALGVEFGYQMLTPNGVFGGSIAPLKDNATEKYMVVLTDGSQTEPAYGSGNSQTVDNGLKNLATLCNNAKNDGITIITVAFDLTDDDPKKAGATKDRLRACASTPENYFEAKDGKDVSKAFASVTQQVAQNIFLSK